MATSHTDRPGESGRSGRHRLRAVAVAVGLTVAAFVVSLFTGVAFVIPIVLLNLNLASLPVFVALSVATQLGFLLVAGAYVARTGLDVPIERPSARELGCAAGGLVAALAGAIALSALLGAAGLLPESALDEVVAANPNVLLALGALSVVLVAPAEELLFRGVIQGRLRQSFGSVGAVAGASLLFGSMHLANYTGEPAAVIAGALLIAVTGAVLGVLYELTDNLAVPIATHAAYNVVLVGVAYLAL